MDIVRAVEIIRALSDGANPLTGEVLPPEDSCNQPDVIRALHAVLDEISKKKKKNPPQNAGKRWTNDDDRILCEMFDNGVRQVDMQVHFQRSAGAIRARLIRLGKLDF